MAGPVVHSQYRPIVWHRDLDGVVVGGVQRAGFVEIVQADLFPTLVVDFLNFQDVVPKRRNARIQDIPCELSAESVGDGKPTVQFVEGNVIVQPDEDFLGAQEKPFVDLGQSQVDVS